MADYMRLVRSRRGDEPRLHRCSGCGRVDTWGPSWSWYGSIEEVDAIACSRACMTTAMERLPLSKRVRRG